MEEGLPGVVVGLNWCRRVFLVTEIVLCTGGYTWWPGVFLVQEDVRTCRSKGIVPGTGGSSIGS